MFLLSMKFIIYEIIIFKLQADVPFICNVTIAELKYIRYMYICI